MVLNLALPVLSSSSDLHRHHNHRNHHHLHNNNNHHNHHHRRRLPSSSLCSRSHPGPFAAAPCAGRELVPFPTMTKSSSVRFDSTAWKSHPPPKAHGDAHAFRCAPRPVTNPTAAAAAAAATAASTQQHEAVPLDEYHQHFPARPPPAAAAPAATTAQPAVRAWATVELLDDNTVQVVCPSGDSQFARAVFNPKVIHQYRRNVVEARLSAGDQPLFADDNIQINITAAVEAASSSTNSSRASSPTVRPGRSPIRQPNERKRRRSLTPHTDTLSTSRSTTSRTQLDDSDADSGDVSLPPTSFFLDEEDKARQFLKSRFHDLQQGVCKNILKEWIKAIEPKKQSKFPYSNSKNDPDPSEVPHDPAKVPAWWPADTRHREPDHIDRNERCRVFMHILLLFRNMDKDQYQSLLDNLEASKRIARNGWVSLLEESTREYSMRVNASDPEALFRARRKYLQDIYHCARSLEEVSMGEIDEDTRVTYENVSIKGIGKSSKEGKSASRSKALVQKRPRRKQAAVPPPPPPPVDAEDDVESWGFAPRQDGEDLSANSSSGSRMYPEYPGPFRNVVRESSHRAKRESVASYHKRHLHHDEAVNEQPKQETDRRIAPAESTLSQGVSAMDLTHSQPGTDPSPHEDRTTFAAAQPMHAFRHDSHHFLSHPPHAQQYSRSFSEQTTVYVPSPLDAGSNDARQLAAPLSEPYDSKPAEESAEMEETRQRVNYQSYEAQPARHDFNYLSANTFHEGMSVATNDMHSRVPMPAMQPLDNGSDYVSKVEYPSALYETSKEMDASASADTPFQPPNMPTAEYNAYNSSFAPPLPLTYSTAPAHDPYQMGSNHFPSRPELALATTSSISSPNSLYTAPSGSSTMSHSPMSTASTCHPMSRFMATHSQYNEAVNAQPYPMPLSQPADFELPIHGTQMSKSASSLSHDAGGSHFRQSTEAAFHPPLRYPDEKRARSQRNRATDFNL